MKFIDINWGKNEAKGDDLLKNYFYEFPKFTDIKEGKYRYIIGRKGSGKTAIIEAIKNKIEDEPLTFFSHISLKDFPINAFKQLKDESYSQKQQFVPAWSFLILLDLCQIILEQDHGASPNEAIEDLRNFYKENDLENITTIETIQRVTETKNQFSITALYGFLIGSAKTNYKKGKTTTELVHYQKITKALQSLLKTIQTNSTYYIFFYELDENFSKNDLTNLYNLQALCRAIEDIKIFLDSTNISFKPILVLRNDIFHLMQKDNDINKLSDFTFHLDWSISSNSNYTDMSILNIINKRILSSSHNLEIKWQDVIDDTKTHFKIKGGIWQYIAARTFNRPRDIIQFLKCCQNIRPQNKLCYSHVQQAEKEYSDWFFNEIQNEIYSHIPIWEECLHIFRDESSYKLSKQKYASELVRNPKIQEYLKKQDIKIDQLIENLFNFSVLGNYRNETEKWGFKYKDTALLWNRNADLILHFGISKKFRLRF